MAIPTIAQAMEEIDRRLKQIPDFRTWDHKPAEVKPPGAWVQLPDIDYNLVFQGAAHDLVFPVVVIIAAVTARAQKTQLAAYLDPEGPRSVRQAIDGPFGEGYLEVQQARSGSLLLNGAEYWASTLDVKAVLA